MFAHEPSPRLRGYAVWVAEGDARAADVPAAVARTHDPRITELWDPRGVELTAFRAPLHLTSDAWDVYLVYPAGVRWSGATPPAPAYWMHQLDALMHGDVPALDGKVFAAHARDLLASDGK